MSFAVRTATAFACFSAWAMFLAACEDKNRYAGEIARYKASLDLETSELSYRLAMKHIIEQNLQGRLERIARRRGVAEASAAPGDGDVGDADSFKLALDTALRVENLIGRADWQEFKGRNIDPPGFDALVDRVRDRANDLARAAAGRDARTTRRSARQLLSLCQSCHQSYR